MNILIVDDNVQLSDVLNDILTLFDNDVTVCNNPLDVDDIVKNCGYDIIFVDMCMPDITGEDLVRSIKAYLNFEHKLKPIVIPMTGGGDGFSMVEHLISEGLCSVCLYKPFSMDELKRILNDIK